MVVLVQVRGLCLQMKKKLDLYYHRNQMMVGNLEQDSSMEVVGNRNHSCIGSLTPEDSYYLNLAAGFEEAERTPVRRDTCMRCLHGKRSTVLGYIWWVAGIVRLLLVVMMLVPRISTIISASLVAIAILAVPSASVAISFPVPVVSFASLLTVIASVLIATFLVWWTIVTGAVLSVLLREVVECEFLDLSFPVSVVALCRGSSALAVLVSHAQSSFLEIR